MYIITFTMHVHFISCMVVAILSGFCNEPKSLLLQFVSPPTHTYASSKTMAGAEAALAAGSQAADTTEDMEAQLEAAMAKIAELDAVAKKPHCGTS